MTITIAERTRRIAGRAVRTTRNDPGAILPEQPPHREEVRRELAADAARLHVTDLVREHGSPLFVLDVDRVTTQLLALRRELPDVQIHFATTSLPHPAVIRAVDAFGATFEVESRGEIDLLEREGVVIGRCVHSNPVKSVADITGAYLRGIRTFVVDRHSEIDKFRWLPGVAVLVRLSFPDPAADRDTSEFGVPPDEADALVAHCLRAGLRVAGFTFHVGSQTVSARPWMRAIHRTLVLMRRLEHEHGIRFDTLDIGGGFPIAYDERVPAFAELARGIRSALAAAPSRYRILIEPGRFVSAPAMTLVTRVVGTTERPDGEWAYLDDGVSDAYSNLPSEQAHPLVFAAAELDAQPVREPERARVERRLRARRHRPVTLAGTACDHVDVIVRAMPLPTLHAGDLLLSPMMGAYTVATASGATGVGPAVVVAA
ncbi:MAG TPA: type III PLP-dependent enzyme [Agromyces mariniharenae]|nr:type III PLP-dependent enzyme [Agromyces mariniharenae]